MHKKILNLDKPKVMAIVNATPDSFYAKSRVSTDEVLATCQRFISEGAEILDIGAYSSRPGAAEVSQEEELNRALPVIEKIRSEFPEITISIDTFRKKVAQAALDAGADWVNDISGGTLDNQMLDFICQNKTPYILMHMRGNPQTMSNFCLYDDLIVDVVSEVKQKIEILKAADVPVIFDPGIGFSKTINQNYELLKRLPELDVLDCPILVGVSRKSFIWKKLGITPEDALPATTALNFYTLQQGAKILRVHDPLEAKQCIDLWRKLSEELN